MVIKEFPYNYDVWNVVEAQPPIYKGQVYEGNEQVPNGQGVLIRGDGYRYVGRFLNGKAHGEGILIVFNDVHYK